MLAGATRLEKKSEWLGRWNVRTVTVEPAVDGRPAELTWKGGATDGRFPLSTGVECRLQEQLASFLRPWRSSYPLLVVRSSDRELRFRAVPGDSVGPPLGDWQQILSWSAGGLVNVMSPTMPAEQASAKEQREAGLAALVADVHAEAEPDSLIGMRDSELEALAEHRRAMESNPPPSPGRPVPD